MWHTVLNDLGMLSDIDKESLLRYYWHLHTSNFNTNLLTNKSRLARDIELESLISADVKAEAKDVDDERVRDD